MMLVSAFIFAFNHVIKLGRKEVPSRSPPS